MLDILKKILIISSSLILGFGVWYLVMWLIITNPNPFEWSLFSKLVYLILSYGSTEATREYLMKS
jgi:hypothetical protein